MSTISKAKPAKSAQSHSSQTSLFVLEYGTRRVLTGSPTNYEQLQQSIRRHFPEIPLGNRISYHTKALPICKGSFTEISPDIWGTVIPVLSNLSVRADPDAPLEGVAAKRAIKDDEEGSSSCDEDFTKPPNKKRRTSPADSVARDPTEVAGKKWSLNVFTPGGTVPVKVRCSPSTPVDRIHSAVQERTGMVEFKLVWDGNAVPNVNFDTVEGFGMQDGDILEMYPVQRGGKPVIYLLPPSGSEVDASVKLSLVPEWEGFSGIYPVVPITSLCSGGKALEWDVKASSNGTLLEKNTGLEVTYLFWEAEVLPITDSEPLSPLPSPTAESCEPSFVERFIPNQAQLSPDNSVVLEVAKMTPYLDSALKILGLHTEARTSFITYWLPSFLKHQHVALRFLPQKAYEEAAPLEVSPSPDVTVRVFMLFKGLKEDEARGYWSRAFDAAQSDITRWRSVVGVDDRSLADDSLFRVLEWGGMEVLC